MKIHLPLVRIHIRSQPRRWTFLAFLAALLPGCGQEESYTRLPAPTNSVVSHYDPKTFFKTPIQTEAAAQVWEILSDLVKMSDYAVHHQALPTNQLQIRLTERTNSVYRHPSYQVTMGYLDKTLSTRLQVDVIASPSTYQAIAAEVVKWNDVRRSPSPISSSSLDEPGMLDRLLEGTSIALEKESQRVSALLSTHFNSPELHQQAAFLCGLMVLRENAGDFFDSRHSLNRTTAHLAFASALAPSERTLAGRLAEICSLLGMIRQADALAAIQILPTNSPVVAAWRRALEIRATGDYRLLADPQQCRPAERIAWFRAMAMNLSSSFAWQSLPEAERYRLPDYLRYVGRVGTSVEIGHESTLKAVKVEFQELEALHEAFFQGKPLPNEDWKTLINEPPDHCVNSQGSVRVISWGSWGWHSQRHLCAAIEDRYLFYSDRWNVQDQAAGFSRESEEVYQRLALYPFLMMRSAPDETPASDLRLARALAAAAATPQSIPPRCWITLISYGLSHKYGIDRDRAIVAREQWFRHYPLPGTALLHANPASVTMNRPEALLASLADDLPKLAPYNTSILQAAIRTKHPDEKPPAELVERLYQPVAAYSTEAMLAIGWAKRKDPAEYERWVVKAAELDPWYYFKLHDFFRAEKQPDTAFRYLEKGFRLLRDRVTAVGRARELIDGHLDRGNVTEARVVADEAGEVYSFAGLEAKAWFLERQDQLESAYQWLEKLQERYGEPGPLMRFCARNVKKNPQSPLAKKLAETLKNHAPTDLPEVTLSGFQGPPTNGVIFMDLTPKLLGFGFKTNDVIVALAGRQVRHPYDFNRIREAVGEPELKMIVWDGAKYRELTCAPQGQRFDAFMERYSGP